MLHDNALVAETLFPVYRTRANWLSDQASTNPRMYHLSNHPPCCLTPNLPSLAFGYHHASMIHFVPIKAAFCDIFALSDLAATATGVFSGDIGCIHALAARYTLVVRAFSSLAVFQ
ncbi:MAG: hypothetical protein LUQ47_02920 [Methanotrichaceae archaeon]|nr:hypothetical protein [Methanotrichaceae archaeon]